MVFDAAVLAGAHDKIYDGTTTQDDVLEEAKISFAELRAASQEDDETTAINIIGCSPPKRHPRQSLPNTWLLLSTLRRQVMGLTLQHLRHAIRPIL
jgi:hypothetical protein